MTQLFIHIGTHKTGSTAIQSALYGSREKLRRKGIVVIDERMFPGLASFMTMKEDSSEEVLSEQRVFLRRLIDKNRGAHTFLLSWEGLSGDPVTGFNNTLFIAKALKNISADIATKIIIYLRRQDSFIESLYTQSIHQGGGQSFQDYIGGIDRFAYNWERLVTDYASCFGKENVILRRYDKKRLPHSESLLDDFAAIIGASSLNGVPGGRETNQGYSRDALELARICNLQLSPEDRSIFRHILQSSCAKKPYDNYSYFSIDERNQLMASYAESNAAIARDYLQDASGHLFDDIEQEQKEYQGFTPHAAYAILVQIIIEQARYSEERLPYIIKALIKAESFIKGKLSAKLKERIRGYLGK